MCAGCWAQDYGMEIVLNDAVLAAVDAVKDLYEVHAAGGNAHVVTDDWNLEDHHIEWCIGRAQDEGDDLALAALEALRSLSEDERAAALAIHEGYIDREGKELARA